MSEATNAEAGFFVTLGVGVGVKSEVFFAEVLDLSEEVTLAVGDGVSCKLSPVGFNVTEGEDVEVWDVPGGSMVIASEVLAK